MSDAVPGGVIAKEAERRLRQSVVSPAGSVGASAIGRGVRRTPAPLRLSLNLLPESWRDEFAVYPFENSRALFVRPPETLLATAETMVRLAGSLTALFILLAAAVLIRENGREIGICLGVGLSERDVAGRMAGECAVLMALSLLAASFCDPLVRRFLARGYPYLETVGPIPAVNVFGGGTLLFGLAAAAFGVGLTAALTSLYIRVRSPIRLIRQGEE